MGNNLDGSVTEYAKGVAKSVLDKYQDIFVTSFDNKITYITEENLLVLLEEAVSQAETDLY